MVWLMVVRWLRRRVWKVWRLVVYVEGCWFLGGGVGVVVGEEEAGLVVGMRLILSLCEGGMIAFVYWLR